MRFAVLALIWLIAPGLRSAGIGQRHAPGIYFERAISLQSGPVRQPPGGRPMAAGQRPEPGQRPRMEDLKAKGWISGNNMRLESISPTGARISITNKTGNYILQTTMKTAIRSNVPKPGVRKGVVSFSLIDPSVDFDPKIQLTNPRQIGTGPVCGIDCAIWVGPLMEARPASAAFPTERHVMKVWLAKSGRPALPLKVEVAGAGPNGGTVTAAITKLKFLDKIPASLFVVPKGYKIRQAPSAFTKPKTSASAPGIPPARSINEASELFQNRL